MRISSSIAKRLIIVFAMFVATLAPSLASENVISSVMITKARHGLGGYELNIDSTQQVQYRSHIDSDGNVYFDLKNSTLSAGLGTIYDDVANIDNVSVKQLDKNRVRIYVNGKDARNTELVFVNSLFDTTKESAKKVVINRPINEYKSTTYYNTDLEAQEEIQEWDDNSFNFSHLTTTVLSELKNGSSGKVLIILALFAMLAAIVKALASRMSQDREPLIGLNNAKPVEVNYSIGTSAAKIKKQAADELQSVASRNETLRQAQAQLAMAHEKYQQYIQNKYQGNYKQKSIDVDAVRKSIALNQYQKSMQNPYKDQEVIRLNKGFSSVEPKGNYQIPPRPKMQSRSDFTSPYVRRTNNFVKPEIKNEETKQNMRFLESVTKIYERSGRGDLADGLKNSISKAKQTI